MKTRLISSALMTLIVAGCSSSPYNAPQYDPRPSASQTAPRPAPSAQPQRRGFNPATASSADVQLWLEQAATATVEQAQELRLRAAEVLLRDGDLARAEEAVQELIIPELAPDKAVRLAIVRARIHRGHGEFGDALAALTDPLVENYISEQPFFRQIQFSQLRSSMFSIEGDHLSAVRERIYVDPLLNREQQKQNREAIWTGLMQIPTPQLLDNLNSSDERDYLGWLELAAIAKDYQGDLNGQIRQRDNWLQRWPRHPASDNLPGGLADLEELVITRADQIALLLPVSGRLAPYGKAIRDGFFAAYYQARGNNADTPAIRLYDSADASMAELYQRAVRDGSQMIIGPLQKAQVSAMVASQGETMAVPTLALNQIEGQRFPSGLYQFALNPEDEARQLADITHTKGYQRALIITPEGSWGNKVAESFASRWQELGGDIVGSTAFDGQQNNYSKQIKQVLQIDRSQRRLQRLQQIIGVRPQYEPYRRTDTDFIFLAARPNEGRAVKPLLAYHYAGDIPVYATSHIYQGDINPGRDQDINGVHFLDIPWVFNDESEIRRTIDQQLPNSGRYQRMYALGVDSFRLHLRLSQLGGGAQVFGETGTLHLNPLRQVERRLPLAEIRDGKATVVPTGSSEALP